MDKSCLNPFPTYKGRKTGAEPMVQPNPMAEDLRGKTLTAGAGCLVLHHIRLSNSDRIDKIWQAHHTPRVAGC